MLQNSPSIYVGLDVRWLSRLPVMNAVEKSTFMVTSQINSKALITYF